VELSRGAFLQRSGVAVAAMAGIYAVDARRARPAATASAEPKPIPGGYSAAFKAVPANPAIHVFQPAKGAELNTIGDYNGFVAAAEIQGKAKGSDGTAYSYDCDMRFMQGSFVGLDGQLRHATFGFV
jgi:hypothetical protein